MMTDNVAPDGLPVSKTEVYLSRSGFPKRKDLPVGITGAQVRDQYGEPTARITEVRGGRLFEHYYYFNSDRTQLTKATLESGVIVSAESTSQ
jgi:hypothetical protein